MEARRLRGSCRSPVPPVPLGSLERRGRWQRRDSPCLRERRFSYRCRVALVPPAHAGRSPCSRLGSADRPPLRCSFWRRLAPGAGTLDRSSRGRFGAEPRASPGISPHVLQNASEHLPLLPPARPDTSSNILGVSGKALSLNGIKLTVLQDPQRSDCLSGEALAGSSGSRSPCFGTARAAGRACASCRGRLPHPGMGALSGRGENPSRGLGLRGRVAAPCDVS